MGKDTTKTQVSEKGLSIRQALAEATRISAQPKLTLIIEGEISPELIGEIKKLPGTRSIRIY